MLGIRISEPIAVLLNNLLIEIVTVERQKEHLLILFSLSAVHQDFERKQLGFVRNTRLRPPLSCDDYNAGACNAAEFMFDVCRLYPVHIVKVVRLRMSLAGSLLERSLMPVCYTCTRAEYYSTYLCRNIYDILISRRVQNRCQQQVSPGVTSKRPPLLHIHQDLQTTLRPISMFTSLF